MLRRNQALQRTLSSLMRTKQVLLQVARGSKTLAFVEQEAFKRLAELSSHDGIAAIKS